MMGAGEKTEENVPYWMRRGQNKKDEKDQFRVDADIVNNKLLLYANDVEMQAVTDLLVKLGEIPPEGGNSSTVRYMEVSPGDTDALLERIQRAWPSFGRNQLKVVKPKKSPEETSDEIPRPKVHSLKDNTSAQTRPDGTLESQPKTAEFVDKHAIGEGRNIAQPATSPRFTLAQFFEGETDNGDDSQNAEQQNTPLRNFKNSIENRRKTLQPIIITRGVNGGLIIRSEDTRALDLFEELMNELAPPRKEYQIFQLKHALAWWIALKLEDFFKEDDKDKNRRRRWWEGAEQKQRHRLSKRRPLKFISEDDTNTILVQGADPRQLQTIKELLERWDRQIPLNAQSARRSKIFTVQYSKAKTIATTIKEVYRDLLSTNDKDLQRNNPNEQKSKVNRIYYSWGGGDDDQQQRTQVRFKGLLSIGVDELSNILIVSAPESLLENVGIMIKQLDEAARPTSTVRIMKVNSRINSALLQLKLAEIVGTGSPGRRSAAKQAPNQAGVQSSKGNSKGNAKSAN
jgi:hypothetical protein